MRKRHLTLLIFLTWLFTSCALSPTVEPILFAALPKHTATPTPRATLTPFATPTPMPTPIPLPTLTPSTPLPLPAEVGPDAYRAAMRPGDKERIVQKGDFYCIPAGVPYSNTALGDEPFVMLDIF